MLTRASSKPNFMNCKTGVSLGPIVNILFMLIIYKLKISIIKDNTLKGIGSPLLISVDIDVIFDQETKE